MNLKSTPQFDKAYRKFVRRHPHLQKRIDETLRQMSLDLSIPALQSHKLSGKLESLFACSCGYDCRIIFSLEKQSDTTETIILLIDIGTHNEVY